VAEEARFGRRWWDGAMQPLYILPLGVLAAFTAYTRKVQSTVITLQEQIPRAAGTIVTPAQQSARILEWSPGRGASLGKLSGRSLARGAFSHRQRAGLPALLSREGRAAARTSRTARTDFLTGGTSLPAFAPVSVGGRTAAS
jgi:hypothetical protein